MQYSMPQFINNVKFKAVMMTPERAEQLLANNHPRNRSMKKSKIAQMVSDIQEGNWKLTPEPIVVSVPGNLIDGQNRCQAISEAGIAVPVYLCTGIPEEVIVAMDCGASRNVADAAKILDLPIKGVMGVAAVARRMCLGMLSDKKTQLCMPVNKVSITQAGVRAVLARAYYHRPVEETRARCLEFGEILLSGLPKNSKQDSAAVRLRNWLQDNFTRGQRTKGTGARVNAIVVYAKTEKALDHFLKYEPVESLKETSNELFWLPGEKNGGKDIGLAQETA